MMMARKGFSNEDIMEICVDVARSESIYVVVNNDEEANKHIKSKKKSSISQKLKDIKGGFTRKNSSKLLQNGQKGDSTQPPEAVPGLHGRDIVAVAILVGEDGAPIKSYTENDDIPSEEIEAAENVILTRVPVNAPQSKDDIVKENKDPNVKSVVDILNGELDANDRKRLIKRMEKILIRLHTTDLSTARSFLQTDRYTNVRKSIKTDLLSFITKDMKYLVADKR